MESFMIFRKIFRISVFLVCEVWFGEFHGARSDISAGGRASMSYGKLIMICLHWRWGRGEGLPL